MKDPRTACIHPIDQATPSDLAPYRDLKDRHLKAREGVFIAEGFEVVRRLLHSSLDVRSILVTEEKLARLTDDLRTDLPVIVGTLDQIEAVAGFNVHRGVLACGRRPANVKLADVPAVRDPSVRSLVIALENITDAINIGVLIRNAAAFGANLVLLQRCCDAFYRRAVRVSMGNVFRVPLRITDDLAADLSRLAGEFDHHRIAAVTDASAVALSDAAPHSRVALAFGSEGDGLSQSIVRACDERVTVPMSPGSDSINVGVACGVFLHHYCSASESR